MKYFKFIDISDHVERFNFHYFTTFKTEVFNSVLTILISYMRYLKRNDDDQTSQQEP